jgi:hypothetical protein
LKRIALAVLLLLGGAHVAESSIIYKRPPLAQYQLDAIFNDARYAEIEASTKSGKTHGCLAWLFEKALITGRAGRNYWWVAPVYEQAKIAYSRLKLALPPGFGRFNDSELSVTLPNLAIIRFKSAEKPDNLYGDDVYAAVFDEASRGREEAWHALRSTLTKTQGPVRLIGNVKGRRNWFYTLCRKAQAGEPGHHYSKIRAADAVAAGILKAEEVEDARRTLPENVFKELFEADPADDNGNPFGIAAIRGCIKPLVNAPAAAHGIDLAKSVDWTWNIGLAADGTASISDRFQAPWQETIKRVRSRTGHTPALVDSTGVGDPVVEALQRDGERRYPNFEGYKFSSESKQKLMEGLAVAIQSGTVGYPDGPLVSELEAYEYEYTRTGVRYSAPAGMHDDGVCALALAVFKLQGNAGRQRWRPM